MVHMIGKIFVLEMELVLELLDLGSTNSKMEKQKGLKIQSLYH